MADLTKPEGMSDELWADIEYDFNGEESDMEHVLYFTICGGPVEDKKPTQLDLDTWYATTIAPRFQMLLKNQKLYIMHYPKM